MHIFSVNIRLRLGGHHFFGLTNPDVNRKRMHQLYNVGLKSLLHQGLPEPEFDGDLVYKFKKIRGMTDFSDQFRKIIIRYKRIGYNLNIMRQSACLVINPVTVDGYTLKLHAGGSGVRLNDGPDLKLFI